MALSLLAGLPSGASLPGGAALAQLPKVPQFTGAAPTPKPYGDFVAPNPAAVASDPYFQFRTAQGNQAIQRSAAAHGSLLNGGTLKSLASYQQGLASEEAGKAFDRALATYNANKDTNAQNFGQQHTAYGDSLSGYDASLAGNKLGFDESTALYDRSTAARPTFLSGIASSSSSDPQPGYGSGILPFDAYAASVQSERALNAAESDRLRRPLGATGGSLSRPVFG